MKRIYVIHLPESEFKGILSNNNLDIYLNLIKPDL